MPFTADWVSPGANAERSDITLSHVDAGPVHATGVSLRGYGHLSSAIPLQDAHAIGMVPNSPLLIGLVSDGSGRYPHSHWLSETMVRVGWRLLANQLTGLDALPMTPQLLAAQLRQLALIEGQGLCMSIAQEAGNAAVLDGVPTENLDAEAVGQFMACTLQLVVLNTETLEFVWVDVAGDGSAYWRDQQGQIHVIHQGSDATGINRWAPPLPIYRGEPLVRTGRLTLGQMLIMVTDGIGEALLDGSTEESIAFSSRITTRPTVFNIASFVSTIGPNDKDDKTLLLISTE